MKKRAIVLAVSLALVLLAILYLWAPGSVPAGQEPLTVLSSANVDQFENAFDAKLGAPRLVLLLSPT